MRVRKVPEHLPPDCKHAGDMVSSPQHQEEEKKEVKRIREPGSRWADDNCPHGMGKSPACLQWKEPGPSQISHQDCRKLAHGGQALPC